MKIKEITQRCYLVVCKRYYDKYGVNAFVERICYDKEEAEYIAYACEQCDREEYIVKEVS